MKAIRLAVLVLPLWAAAAVVQAQFIYATNADGISLTITEYTGTNREVSIPTNLDDLTVTGIATNAFFDATNLISVAIPATVTNIASDAFQSCSNLVSVFRKQRSEH